MTKKRLTLGGILLALLALFRFHPTPKPTPEPTPSPSVTPVASTTPPAEPSPLPTPPLSYLCQLPPTQAPGECVENPSDPPDYPQFMDAVRTAQDQAEANGFVKDGLVVPTIRAYTSEVTRLLRVMGYCATNEILEDEVAIKNSNAFSEAYDIVTSKSEPWTKYAAICRPSRF